MTHNMIPANATPFLNDENYLSWFEFWHPKKAAALASEERYNEALLDAKGDQDELDANMSLWLSLLEAKRERQNKSHTEDMSDTYISISLIVAVGLIIGYFIYKKY